MWGGDCSCVLCQSGPQARAAVGRRRLLAAQRADIEHAKAKDERAYLGRKPSFTREQFVKVRAMLGQQAVGIAQIAKETGLSRIELRMTLRVQRLLWLLGGCEYASCIVACPGPSSLGR